MHLSNKGNLEGHQQHSPVLCCFSQLFALDSFTLPSHSMSETLTGYSFKKINKMMKNCTIVSTAMVFSETIISTQYSSSLFAITVGIISSWQALLLIKVAYLVILLMPIPVMYLTHGYHTLCSLLSLYLFT